MISGSSPLPLPPFFGRTMTGAILDHYPMDRFHHQVLVAERGAEGFYRRLGMVPVTSYGLTAFIRARR